MIEKRYQRPEYEVARCDGCRRDLRQHDGGGIENVNYGLLKSSFGWPSPIDDVGSGVEYHLCEGCWLKVLAVFGLPVTVESNGGRLMPDGTEVDGEGEAIGVWDVQGAIAKARALGPTEAE